MNAKKVKLVACATVLLAGMALRADEVVLAPGRVDVVLPKKAWPVEKFAAEELTNFLSRVLGAAVPVVQKPAADRAAILLGRAAELDVSGLERDAFRTKVESGTAPRIRIAGIDEKGDLVRYMRRKGEYTHIQRATLFGAYAFLEDFAGVRFYFPGELGTVANRRTNVRVPVQDKVTAPYFSVRRVSIGRDGVWYEPLPEGWHQKSGKALNWFRQRYETTKIPCCHGQNNFKIVERFAKTHPEYCQLRKDGTRCTRLEREAIGRHQKQLCQSSKVWDIFHDDILARKNPRYADVMPQDGYRACECPDCQKAYRRTADGKLIHDMKAYDAHRTLFTRDFYMAIYPATQKQYSLMAREFTVESHRWPSHFTNAADRATRPAEMVAWSYLRETQSIPYEPGDRMTHENISGDNCVIAQVRRFTGLRVDIPTVDRPFQKHRLNDAPSGKFPHRFEDTV